MKIEKAAAEDIDETEWQKLLDKFIVWSDSCDYIRLGSSCFRSIFEVPSLDIIRIHYSEYLGSVMGLQRPNETDIKVDDTVKKVADWLHNTMTGIDAENGKLSGMLTNCQRHVFQFGHFKLIFLLKTAKKSDMVKWMSSSLLLLVPDKSNNHLLRQIAIPSQVAASELISQQEMLAQRCIDLSGKNLKILKSF